MFFYCRHLVLTLIFGMLLCTGNFICRANSEEPQGTVTVQDVIDGIVARKSSIADRKIDYTFQTKETKFGIEYTNWANELRRKRGEVVQDRRADANGSPAVPILFSNRYVLKTEGDKVSYDIVGIKKGVVEQKFAFDGEVLKNLNIIKRQGLIAIENRSRAIPTNRIETLLSLRGVDVVDFLSQKDSHKEIMSATRQDGDQLIKVRIWMESSVKYASPEGEKPVPFSLSYELMITINASKSFWPVSIRYTNIVTDNSNGKQARLLTSETVVSEFKRSEGIYYPSSVEKKEYGQIVSDSKDSVLPIIEKDGVVRYFIAKVNSVDINQGLSDTEFELAFPPGTRYIDKRDGKRYIVGVDHAIKELLDDKPRYPVSKYPDRRLAQSSPTVFRWICVIVGLGMIAVAVGVTIRKRRQKGRS
jgi:hypothetical protein